MPNTEKGNRIRGKERDVSSAMEWGRLLVRSLKANRTGLRKQYETTTKYGKEDSLRYK
jgi:hypothetical protein